MRAGSWIKMGVGLALGVVAAITGRGQNGVTLQAGDRAPNFSLPGSDGRTHTLEEYRGRSAVVLAWFPKAFTGG